MVLARMLRERVYWDFSALAVVMSVKLHIRSLSKIIVPSLEVT